MRKKWGSEMTVMRTDGRTTYNPRRGRITFVSHFIFLHRSRDVLLITLFSFLMHLIGLSLVCFYFLYISCYLNYLLWFFFLLVSPTLFYFPLFLLFPHTVFFSLSTSLPPTAFCLYDYYYFCFLLMLLL